ncbi:alpha/beta fold hydrolase [Kribbella sp. NPDC051770]|uniref:alpha/beta fold hydrolase n=1 Tax=Kribbella sp. NPDC051770 TaxID=3155413 RepID=UPI0034363B24
MKYILVPGGWQGAWAFDAVTAELRSAGHEAEAITLSGLDDDRPPVPPNLTTHITQLTDLIAGVEGPLTLCGHSYAGLVIAGAAARLPERLTHLVFIDAYVPTDGDSCWSLTTDTFRNLFITGAHPDGRWVAVPEGMDPRARPHPLPSFLQSITLPPPTTPPYARTFISGGDWPGTPFTALAARLRNDATWNFHEIPVGHNIARRDPSALAAVLDALPPH